jgi:hypothetical protein
MPRSRSGSATSKPARSSSSTSRLRPSSSTTRGSTMPSAFLTLTPLNARRLVAPAAPEHGPIRDFDKAMLRTSPCGRHLTAPRRHRPSAAQIAFPHLAGAARPSTKFRLLQRELQQSSSRRESRMDIASARHGIPARLNQTGLPTRMHACLDGPSWGYPMHPMHAASRTVHAERHSR